MRPEPTLALVRHNLLLAGRDRATIVVMIAMPLLLAAFLANAFRPALVAEGYPWASGAEQSVPGMATMFALFLMGTVGFRVFDEHSWGTWDRLRASTASPYAVLLAKALPPLIVVLVQQTVLFGAGVTLMGLEVAGSMPALVLVAASLAVCVATGGLLLSVVSRSLNELNVLANLSATLLAGLGGALAPVAVLPDWARTLAPATPVYWATRSFRAVILDGATTAEVVSSVGAVLAFATAFGAIAVLRFRVDEPKSTT